MGKQLAEYHLGQVVVSKKGKDAGRAYVIVGFRDSDRLALADAERFNISDPKNKNPKHVQPTAFIIPEVAVWVKERKKLDRGHLLRLLTPWMESACKKSEQRGRVANGK